MVDDFPEEANKLKNDMRVYIVSFVDYFVYDFTFNK